MIQSVLVTMTLEMTIHLNTWIAMRGLLDCLTVWLFGCWLRNQLASSTLNEYSYLMQQHQVAADRSVNMNFSNEFLSCMATRIVIRQWKAQKQNNTHHLFDSFAFIQRITIDIKNLTITYHFKCQSANYSNTNSCNRLIP